MATQAARAVSGHTYRYYDLLMAAFVAVMLCSSLIGVGKVAQIGGNVAVIDVMAAREPDEVVKSAFAAAADEVLRSFDPPLCAISVDEVSSDLLGEIVRFRTRGCSLALYGASPRVRQLFTLTWLERIMKLTPTLQDAIAFLQTQSPAPMAAAAGRADLAVRPSALQEIRDV